MVMMKDDLGDRMKEYEAVTRQFLPRRTYTLIRIDGKAFHSYTKDLARPYDIDFMDDMDHTTVHLCKIMSGAQFGFVQSDEISILLTDFNTIHTQPWFGGNVQKLVSVSASGATWMFNRRRALRNLSGEGSKVALFDSRAFTIPDPTEVHNYFVWRQKDATRNSISSAAQARFSNKELHGLSTDQMQEKLFQIHGINWNDYPVGFKRGRLIRKLPETRTVQIRGEERTIDTESWQITEPDIFTQSKQLKELIPLYE